MRRVTWLLMLLVATGCGISPAPASSASRQAGPCGVRTVNTAPRSITVTRVKPDFRHGETSITNLIALADESFIVLAQTPGTTGNDGRGGPGQQYEYRFDASGHVLEQRDDWEGSMAGSPIDLTYFYSDGPDQPLMWMDAAGVSRRAPITPYGIPFRDSAGRFWQLIHYTNGPSQLLVNGKQVNLGGDDVTTAAAACDGTVWALASDGHIWRIGDGGRTPRIVMSLPAGKGTFSSDPYNNGEFLAMSDGTVWLGTSRDDPTLPVAEQLQTHLFHLGPDGLIGEAPSAVADFSAWAEGPDGALWLSGPNGLIRLPEHGPLRSYPAPWTQWLVQDATGRLWLVCQPDLCAVTLNH
jgi:hypothetical protein